MQPFGHGCNPAAAFGGLWQPQLFQDNRRNMEIRPIIGVRFAPIESLVNPIVNPPLSGTNRRISFEPAARLP